MSPSPLYKAKTPTFLCPRPRMHLLSLFTLALCSPAATAWWATGHLLVSSVAYSEMSPALRSKALLLTQNLNNLTPTCPHFIDTATWMDQIKDAGLHMFDTYHYCAPATNVSVCPSTSGILYGLNQASVLLSSPHLPFNSFQKAFLLRYITHAIGDLHQPLHAGELHNDRGGNDFPIQGTPSNLHAFWDSGAGAWKEVSRPLQPSDYDYLYTTAASLKQTYPRSVLTPRLSLTSFADWAKESTDIVRDVIYKGIEPGAKLTEEYVKKAQEIAKQQVTLAGYRLADTLQKVLGAFLLLRVA